MACLRHAFGICCGSESRAGVPGVRGAVEAESRGFYSRASGLVAEFGKCAFFAFFKLLISRDFCKFGLHLFENAGNKCGSCENKGLTAPRAAVSG
jgi:hypothetical protein